MSGLHSESESDRLIRVLREWKKAKEPRFDDLGAMPNYDALSRWAAQHGDWLLDRVTLRGGADAEHRRDS